MVTALERNSMFNLVIRSLELKMRCKIWKAGFSKWLLLCYVITPEWHKCNPLIPNSWSYLFLIQSKRKGLSVEEKRTRMMEFFFEKVNKLFGNYLLHMGSDFRNDN